MKLRPRFGGALLVALYLGVPAAAFAADDLDDLLGAPANAPANAPINTPAPQPAAEAAAPAPSAPTADAAPAAASSDAPVPVPGDAAATAATAATGKPKASTNRLVEEIVVTAQKREENIQDVPISIQAFTAEKLDVLGIQSVQDIQRATPGLTVTGAAAFNIVFLRGVGSDAFLPGVDSSVPFYLDGVPLLAIQGTADTLGRISRVEVLKGPQGTLFGRNSTGGAISIVTPDPGQEFNADVKTEFGDYAQRNVVAYANVPVTKSLAFNVSGFYNSRNNFLQNDSTGGVYPIYARGGRLKLRWDPVDQFSATLSGTYQETSSNGDLGFQLVKAALPFAALLPTKTLDHHVSLDSPFGTKGNAYVFGSTFEWKPEYVDAKLIYAKQKVYTPTVDADFDGTATHLASAHGSGFGGAKQYVQQDTAELQFLSNANTPFAEHLQWAAGLFYLSSLGGFDPIVFEIAPAALATTPLAPLSNTLNQVIATANLPPILGPTGIQLANSGLIRSRSYSAYAQGTWHVIDTVDFTAGVRQQSEKRKLQGSRTFYELANGTDVTLPLPEGDKDPLHPKQTSLRTALQWRPLGPDKQIYASWARGYKNPTFNTVNLLGNTLNTMNPLLAERVDTTEAGIKSQWFDGSLQLNVAGFLTEQKNPLSSNVTIISGGIANFTNAGHARIVGTDGDVLVIPMPVLDPGLVFTGGFSYLDAIYTSFKNGRGYDDTTGLGFGDGGASLPARDLSGKRIPRVPKVSYQAGLSQRIDFDDRHSVELGADTFYTSKIYFLPQNSEITKRSPTQLFNARVSYFYHPWNVELTLYGNNLTNKTYVDSAFVSDFGSALIANEDVRVVGLRAKLAF